MWKATRYVTLIHLDYQNLIIFIIYQNNFGIGRTNKIKEGADMITLKKKRKIFLKNGID